MQSRLSDNYCTESAVKICVGEEGGVGWGCGTPPTHTHLSHYLEAKFLVPDWGI